MNCIIKSWLMFCTQKLGHWFISSWTVVTFCKHTRKMCFFFSFGCHVPYQSSSKYVFNLCLNVKSFDMGSQFCFFQLFLLKIQMRIEGTIAITRRNANLYCLIDIESICANWFLLGRFSLVTMWHNFQYNRASIKTNELEVNWVFRETRYKSVKCSPFESVCILKSVLC